MESVVIFNFGNVPVVSKIIAWCF